MKTILAATDFSKASRNAVNYAAEIARKSNARLILFHSYMPPIIVSDVPVVMSLPEDVEKNALKTLRRMTSGLILKYGKNLKPELVCKYGMAVDAINTFAKERQVDLIVMGMEGSGYLEEKLVGSITTTLIAKCETPVLSIGKKIKYKAIKKIALATDYLAVGNSAVLNPLKDIAGLFKSHIYVLNVVPDTKTLPNVKQAIQGIHIENALKGCNHSFHATVNKNVAEGINEFVATNKIDMVVMIPRRHSVFKTVFKGRQTKKVAFHSSASLLTLHE